MLVFYSSLKGLTAVLTVLGFDLKWFATWCLNTDALNLFQKVHQMKLLKNDRIQWLKSLKSIEKENRKAQCMIIQMGDIVKGLGHHRLSEQLQCFLAGHTYTVFNVTQTSSGTECGALRHVWIQLYRDPPAEVVSVRLQTNSGTVCLWYEYIPILICRNCRRILHFWTKPVPVVSCAGLCGLTMTL